MNSRKCLDGTCQHAATHAGTFSSGPIKAGGNKSTIDVQYCDKHAIIYPEHWAKQNKFSHTTFTWDIHPVHVHEDPEAGVWDE